ncbi:MAG: hypothetical protein QF473_08640 [Planctomycetota bacterium]|nr:hypothetical protein [Planctomycetota bacterium]
MPSGGLPMKMFASAVCVWLAMGLAASAAELPPGTEITSLAEEDEILDPLKEIEDGYWAALADVEVALPRAKGKAGEAFSFSGSVGDGKGVVQVQFLSRSSIPENRIRYVIQPGDLKMSDREMAAVRFTQPEICHRALPDAFLALSRREQRLRRLARLFIRPNIKFYSHAKRVKAIHRWQETPPASTHIFHLEFRFGAKLEIWLDGRLVHVGDNRFAKASQAVVQLPGGAVLGAVGWGTRPKTDRFLPLGVSHLQALVAVSQTSPSLDSGEGSSGEMPGLGEEDDDDEPSEVDAPRLQALVADGELSLSLKPGLRVFKEMPSRREEEKHLAFKKVDLSAGSSAVEARFAAGQLMVRDIPIDIAAGNAGIAIEGLGRQYPPSIDLTSLYWEKCAFIGSPECRMFTVPETYYSDAYVLCAADPEAEKETKAFTLRMTRYGNSRGGPMADSLVDLNDPDLDKVRAGTATFRGKEAPLWLVRIPLRSGELQEIIEDDVRGTRLLMKRYFDVELMDPLVGLDEEVRFPPLLPRVQARERSQLRSRLRLVPGQEPGGDDGPEQYLDPCLLRVRRPRLPGRREAV